MTYRIYSCRMARVVIACLCCFQLALLPESAQLKAAAKTTIVVVEGQGAVNSIRQRTARDTIVRVEDENHNPVADALVVFTLPSDGASGSFLDGSKTFISTTDAEGRAVARGFQPNNVAGNVEIRVNASFQGQVARTTITQFNMTVQPKSGSSKKWIAILAAVGGAGAAGAVVASRGGSKTSPSATPPPAIGISAGSGTVGPPN